MGWAFSPAAGLGAWAPPSESTFPVFGVNALQYDGSSILDCCTTSGCDGMYLFIGGSDS